ncbi:hypothetical protein ACJX0J_033868, partial [Zea mays]
MEAGDTVSSMASPMVSDLLRAIPDTLEVVPSSGAGVAVEGDSGDLVRDASGPWIWGGLTLTWMSTKGDTYFILDNTKEQEMWEELRVVTQEVMTRSMAMSIFVHCERGVWTAIQHHRAMMLRSNEQLALRSSEVADLTSWCVGLKEEGANDRVKLCLLEDEVCRLKAEADLREEEMRQMKGNLHTMVVERDESQRQVAEASLCVDSLNKHLEAERFEGRALKARIG